MIETLLNFLLRFPEWFQMTIVGIVSLGLLFVLVTIASRGVKYGSFEIPGKRKKKK